MLRCLESWLRLPKSIRLSRFVSNLSAVDRALVRQQRTMRRMFIPRWLRRCGTWLEARFQWTESQADRAIRLVRKSVAVGLRCWMPVFVRRIVRATAREAWRAARLIVAFLGGWLGTRRYRQLVFGTPAFLLALPLAICLFRLPFHTNDVTAQQYRTAAAAAWENKHYEAADLYYRKLYQLDAVNESIEFQAALNAYQQGAEAEAIARFHDLAPNDRPGFVPAHLWLAQWYLRGESQLATAESLSAAERHLQLAVECEPGNPQIRAMRAACFQHAGRWDEALEELRRVSRYQPEIGLNLARLYARQRRWQAAHDEINKIVAVFETKQQHGQPLTDVEYEIWSESHLIAGENSKAEGVLEQGLTMHPDASRIRDRLYTLYMKDAAVPGEPSGSEESQLRRLLRSAQLKPAEHDPLIRIAQMSMIEGKTGTEARATIRQLMTSADPPGVLSAIVGTAAAAAGRYHESVGYLQQAVQSTPDDPQVLNNLSWVLLQLKSDLPAALQLANRAVELRPDMPMYRETRGQVLMCLQRYAEAIKDLELALNAVGQDGTIHRAIAEAYEAVGQLDLARIHRQQVQ
jgi:tetratricopeptide (TPR) repeat protein